MTRLSSRIAVFTVALLLAVDVSIEALPMTDQTDDAVAQVRKVLLRDAWVHDVRVGRIAIESYVLVFQETGEMSERILDDTGIHDTKGTWKLEESDGKVILVLTGELRNKGRFVLTRDVKGDAIELRLVESETALRFQHRKGYRTSS